MGRLTALDVQRLGVGKHSDGDGLYLQVGAAGARSWIFRYMVAGKERYLGLGSASLVSLADARKKALDARRQRADGVDPLAVKAATQAAAVPIPTFQDAAEQYIAGQQAGWRNAKHRQQWANTLATYAYPALGNVAVDKITAADVLRVLQPIWPVKPETASRVRGRIEQVLDYGKVQNWRSGENPAQWRGNLAHALPAKNKVRPVEHRPALPYHDLPVFMVDLRTRTSITAKALEFTILTAVRTDEALGARWPELDLDRSTWAIPAVRMKARREHRVPLAPAVLDLLRALPRVGDYVFPGMKPGRPLSNMAMLKLLALMGHGDVTVHGFRSTFRDWAAEQTTEFPEFVIEAALAHGVRDKTERAYKRTDLFDKRRKLMAAWAGFCGGRS